MTALRKTILLFSVAIFFILSMPGMSGGMFMDEHGNMPGCPYMNGTTACKMNPLEHVAAWQNMFTTLPLSMGLIALLLLAVFAVAFFQISWSTDTTKPILLYNHRFRFKPPIPRHTLQEAFSNGILNPKVF